MAAVVATLFEASLLGRDPTPPASSTESPRSASPNKEMSHITPVAMDGHGAVVFVVTNA